MTGVDFGWNFDTVANTNNTGQGSLRQFLTNANTLGGDASLAQSGLIAAKENAVFMISNGAAAAGLRAANNYFAGGAATITPTTALPTISTAMILDAQKQPGWSSTPVVVLDGNGIAADGLVLSATADGTTIRGLVIRDFGTTTNHDAIEIQASSDNNTIAGNFIGRLTNTGADAGAAEANTGKGLNILGANNTIGGATAADGNVISGNNSGVFISGSGASGNVVVRNQIGTDASGTVLIGIGGNGVDIGSGAPNTTIGGIGAGNVIVGSGNDNLTIWGSGNTGTKVQGNRIGTDPTGALDWGAAGYGVIITGDAVGAVIGGAIAGEGNVIAFNNKDGVGMDANLCVTNPVLGNSIYSNTELGIDLVGDERRERQRQRRRRQRPEQPAELPGLDRGHD